MTRSVETEFRKIANRCGAHKKRPGLRTGPERLSITRRCSGMVAKRRAPLNGSSTLSVAKMPLDCRPSAALAGSKRTLGVRARPPSLHNFYVVTWWRVSGKTLRCVSKKKAASFVLVARGARVPGHRRWVNFQALSALHPRLVVTQGSAATATRRPTASLLTISTFAVSD